MAFKMFEETKSTSNRLWAGWMLAIFTYDPNDVEILLTNEHCYDKPYVYEHFHINTSLIVIDKEPWKVKRRAINSTFSKVALQTYLPLLNEKVRILTDKIAAHANQSYCDVYRTISIGMLDTVLYTLMGVDMRMQSGRGEQLYPLIKQVLNEIMYRVVRVWWRFDFIYYSLSQVGRAVRYPLKVLEDIVQEIRERKINELKAKQLESDEDYLQVLDRSDGVHNVLEKSLLLQRDGLLAHQCVADQMRVMIVAGIDTSTITIFSTLLMLAINKKHQELVVDELRSIFETADCEVTPAHLASMNYTERVIKECMRLIPPVPVIARQLTADVEFPNGTLPNGTIVIVSILHMHRNPNVWGENALEFDPDRFSPENIAKRPPFSYIPFSNGPRNCIGMKYAMQTVKTALAYLLRKYKFSTDLQFEDIEFSTHLIMDINNENPLRVEHRTF